MLCSNCKTNLQEGALFCHKCGTKVENNNCSSCGKELIKDALFCPYCGEKVKTDTKNNVQIKKEPILFEIIDEDWFANNKSFYINSNSKDFNRMFYQGMIYFISSSANEIWKMYEDGTNLECVVTKDKNDNNEYIGVNRRGIFTYGKFGKPYVYNYSFDGELINTAKLQIKDNQYFNDIFIFDDRIYYISNDETDSPKQNVYSIGIDGTNPITIYKGTTKTEIDRILALDEYAIFHIKFNGSDSTQDGWYMYELATAKLINLNSEVLPPHEILTHPKRFDCDSRSYIVDNDRVEIFGFDLINQIMWTFASESEAKQMNLDEKLINRMIFPRNIGVGPDQPILEDIDPWILPSSWYGYTISYSNDYVFNGEYLFYIQSYYRFYGIYNNGTKSEDWNQTLHGRSETIQLTGNSLIGDLYADYRDSRYPIGIEKPVLDEITPCNWATPFILNRDSLGLVVDGSITGYNSSRRLLIGDDIADTDITGFKFSERYFLNFDEIYIDDENHNFVIENGMLFNADKTKLIRYFADSYNINIIIPNTVIELGPNAFFKKAFKSISLPESLKIIGEDTFNDCEIKDSLDIPKSVTTIADRAFLGFKTVTIKIPNSVTKIGEMAFKFLQVIEDVVYEEEGSYVEEHIKEYYNVVNQDKAKLYCIKRNSY